MIPGKYRLHYKQSTLLTREVSYFPCYVVYEVHPYFIGLKLYWFYTFVSFALVLSNIGNMLSKYISITNTDGAKLILWKIPLRNFHITKPLFDLQYNFIFTHQPDWRCSTEQASVYAVRVFR